MNLEENNEQPPAKIKPPSDFNDLHVISGLSEVRLQIETAISSSDFAVAVSPHPLDSADHNLGGMSENQANIGNSDADFKLDFAPPMNGHSETGQQLETGSGEDFRVIDPNSPAAKLKNNDQQIFGYFQEQHHFLTKYLPLSPYLQPKIFAHHFRNVHSLAVRNRA